MLDRRRKRWADVDSRVVPNVPSQYRTKTFILIKVCILIDLHFNRFNPCTATQQTQNICTKFVQCWPNV